MPPLRARVQLSFLAVVPLPYQVDCACLHLRQVVDLDPMTVDEAIDAMEAVGHDFFVFREMESDFVQVG